VLTAAVRWRTTLRCPIMEEKLWYGLRGPHRHPVGIPLTPGAVGGSVEESLAWMVTF